MLPRVWYAPNNAEEVLCYPPTGIETHTYTKCSNNFSVFCEKSATSLDDERQVFLLIFLLINLRSVFCVDKNRERTHVLHVYVSMY